MQTISHASFRRPASWHRPQWCLAAWGGRDTLQVELLDEDADAGDFSALRRPLHVALDLEAASPTSAGAEVDRAPTPPPRGILRRALQLNPDRLICGVPPLSPQDAERIERRPIKAARRFSFFAAHVHLVGGSGGVLRSIV